MKYDTDTKKQNKWWQLPKSQKTQNISMFVLIKQHQHSLISKSHPIISR